MAKGKLDQRVEVGTTRSIREPVFYLILTIALTVITWYPPIFNYLREISLEWIILIRREYATRHTDILVGLMSDVADKYGMAVLFCVAQVLLSPVNCQILLAAS